MVGWHHRLDGDEFEQTLGDGEGRGSLVLCRPWDCKESDMTEQLAEQQQYVLNCLILKHFFQTIFMSVITDLVPLPSL